MKYIGFKNFRRFENLHPLELAPISIFVGGNNSGKSTVVKGILTVLGFFRDKCDVDYKDEEESSSDNFFDSNLVISRNQRFRFNSNYYAHIGTCHRALHLGANPKEITFILFMRPWHYEIRVIIDDDSEDATSGRISRIIALRPDWNLTINYDLIDWSAKVSFDPIDPTVVLTERDKFQPDSGEYSRLDKLYGYSKSFDKPYSFTINLPEFESTYDHLILALHHQVERIFEASLEDTDVSSTPESKDSLPFRSRRGESFPKIELTEDEKEFLSNCPCYKSRLRRFSVAPITCDNVEYIYAHAVTQSVIYSAKDLNDYLVKTIHEFANLRISSRSRGKGRTMYEFILHWMDVFNIGSDYLIRSTGGEAHIVTIKNRSGNYVNLADLGMGSIQLMILLFRIATVLDSETRFNTTIILEEPEQNLHPMLQSKLADLFLEIYKEYHISFIVETHSEYLIRRTQVIVGEQYGSEEELIKNPFRVFYFPNDGEPYDMEYLPSGKFNQPFGEGFFDEAANLHMQVLKNSRK